MLYDYNCPEHGLFEASFQIGEAPPSTTCPECGSEAKRAFTSCNFQLKGGGWPSKSLRLNREMTQRNERAGRRMKKEHGDGPMKLVAHDHGGGDVREV